MPVHRPTIKNPYYSIKGGRAMAQRGGYAGAKYNLQQAISGGRVVHQSVDGANHSVARPPSRRPNQSRLGKIMKFLG